MKCYEKLKSPSIITNNKQTFRVEILLPAMCITLRPLLLRSSIHLGDWFTNKSKAFWSPERQIICIGVHPSLFFKNKFAFAFNSSAMDLQASLPVFVQANMSGVQSARFKVSMVAPYNGDNIMNDNYSKRQKCFKKTNTLFN